MTRSKISKAFLVAVLLGVTQANGRTILLSQNDQASRVNSVEDGSGTPAGLNINYWNPIYPIGNLTTRVSWDTLSYTGINNGEKIGVSQKLGTSLGQVGRGVLGVIIDTQSLLSPSGFYPHGTMPIMVQYPFTNHPRISQNVQISFDMQVPYSWVAKPARSANYIVVYVGLQEKETERIVGLGANVWDSRGNSRPYINMDRCKRPARCTGNLIITSPINSGVFNETTPDSVSFQSHTWNGFRHFVFSLTAEKFKLAIKAAKSRFGLKMSDRLSDYRLNQMVINSEVYYGGSAARFGYSVKNIVVSVE